MLYPGNSGHARTHGVRWRNVCFLCSRFLFPALFCGASPLALGSKSFDQRGRSQTRSGSWASRRSGFETEPHQRLAGRLEKGTWIRLQVDFNRPFVLHRSPKCHVRACAMEDGSGCCRRWLYQPVAVSACDSNIWALAAGPLSPSLYLYLYLNLYRTFGVYALSAVSASLAGACIGGLGLRLSCSSSNALAAVTFCMRGFVYHSTVDESSWYRGLDWGMPSLSLLISPPQGSGTFLYDEKFRLILVVHPNVGRVLEAEHAAEECLLTWVAGHGPLPDGFQRCRSSTHEPLIARGFCPGHEFLVELWAADGVSRSRQQVGDDHRDTLFWH